MQLPNISSQILEAIKYYDEHIKAINAEYVEEDEVKGYIKVWLDTQCRLAWEKYYAEYHKKSNISN